MTLGGLGARERRSVRLPIIPIFSAVLLLAGIVQFGRELVVYSQTHDDLASDVRIAGVQVGGLSESEAQSRWEELFVDQPIKVIYHDSPIMLSPESLGFRTNNEAMLAAARVQRTGESDFWGGFFTYLLDEEPPAIQVALDATLQEGQLRATLEDISARYDSIPGGANFDITSLTFRGGPGGSRLDIDASIALIKAALYNPDPQARVIELPTVVIEGDNPGMDDLRESILAYMQAQGFVHDGVTTVGSLFVMNLETGEEISILGDVAHSAVSTIKLGVLINYFRYEVVTPPPDLAYFVAAAMICSQNDAANFLMQVTAGNTGQGMIGGLLEATETMIEVGATNSAILSPLYVGPDGVYPVVARPQSPTTPNGTYNAQPDPYNFSTAEDMGTMLQMVYDCAYKDSGLRLVYPDQITQTECQQMIEVMTGVRFSRFTELGAPEGTKIAHKVGYGAETVGDVAIVFSPGADYAFVMYIWEEDLNNNFLTELDKWALIDNVSRIAYNYFNQDAPLTQTRPPDNPLGGAACVMPKTSAEVNLNNIAQNRFDENGNPVPTACYDYPACRPFDNWGRGQ